MAELVDKQWGNRGLDHYSTSAILGTLRHYGVATSEAELVDRFEHDFAPAVAVDWYRVWKGRGQFSDFPVVAASVLFDRLANRVDPSSLSFELEEAVMALDSNRPIDNFEMLKRMLDRATDEVLHEARSDLLTPASVRAALSSAVAVMPEAVELLLRVDEVLWPSHRALGRATVAAAKGDPTGLLALVRDQSKADQLRLEAAFLASHESGSPARATVLELLRAADERGDYALARFATRVLDRHYRALVEKPCPDCGRVHEEDDEHDVE